MECIFAFDRLAQDPLGQFRLHRGTPVLCTYHPAFLLPGRSPHMRGKVVENETECFRLIEDRLLQGPWVMGEQYTVADGYLFTIAGWLEEDGVDLGLFPAVVAHMDRMRGRPAVGKVLAEEGG